MTKISNMIKLSQRACVWGVAGLALTSLWSPAKAAIYTVDSSYHDGDVWIYQAQTLSNDVQNDAMTWNAVRVVANYIVHDSYPIITQTTPVTPSSWSVATFNYEIGCDVYFTAAMGGQKWHIANEVWQGGGSTGQTGYFSCE